MAWPCRLELWGDQLAAARHAFAEVANAIAAFEPVTMVVQDEAASAEARGMLAGNVDLIELVTDDSWMRDLRADIRPRRARPAGRGPLPVQRLG